MVSDELWAEAGAPSESCDFYLCVGCLEDRLGRRLAPSDFPQCELNDDSPWDSPRLADRKGVGRDAGWLHYAGRTLVGAYGLDLDRVAELLGIDARVVRKDLAAIEINRRWLAEIREQRSHRWTHRLSRKFMACWPF